MMVSCTKEFNTNNTENSKKEVLNVLPFTKMNIETLKKFIREAENGNLKVSHYQKKFMGLNIRVSFGKGFPAHVPWIAFLKPGESIRQGHYPAFLYYKKHKLVILAFCVGRDNLMDSSYPKEYFRKYKTVETILGSSEFKYSKSLVFKSYKVSISNDSNRVDLICLNNEKHILDADLFQEDLKDIVKLYKE